MMQIGVDLFNVERMQEALKGGEPYLDYVFTKTERELSHAHQDDAYYYGSLFALKEATFKAMQTSWQPEMTWQDFEIISQPQTFPLVQLHGKSRTVASELGLTNFSASNSYDGLYILASVVCSKE